MVFRFPGVLAADSVDALRSAAPASAHPSPSEGGRDAVAASSQQTAPGELSSLLVSAVRAHPDFEPSVYPAAFSSPAWHRFRAATGSASELARPLAGTDPTLRVDVSVLLWLSDKAAYDGGDVLLDDGGAVTRWTGEAGDAIAYPSGSRRSVAPITRGELLVCVLDVQSLIAGEAERRILFDFHRALQEFERRPPSAQHAQTIRRVYSGLVRMWAEIPRPPSAP